MDGFGGRIEPSSAPGSSFPRYLLGDAGEHIVARHPHASAVLWIGMEWRFHVVLD
jgi:hypothetical protein